MLACRFAKRRETLARNSLNKTQKNIQKLSAEARAAKFTTDKFYLHKRSA